jgi:hypothetical protein
MLVNLGTKGKVVNEHNCGLQDFETMLFFQKIAMGQFEFGVFLAIKFHPESEPFF